MANGLLYELLRNWLFLIGWLLVLGVMVFLWWIMYDNIRKAACLSAEGYQGSAEDLLEDVKDAHYYTTWLIFIFSGIITITLGGLGARSDWAMQANCLLPFGMSILAWVGGAVLRGVASFISCPSEESD